MEQKNSISAWLSSSIVNKVGTVLWALAGIFYLVVGIKWLSIVDDVGLDTMKPLFLLFVVYFLFYIGLTVGILFSNNLCASIAKTWGILSIVTAVAYLVMFLAALIESNVGPVDIVEMLGYLKDGDGFGSFTVLFLLSFVFTIASAFTISVSDAPKSRLAALVFCILTGMFGGHLIYANRTKKAVLRIVLTVTLVLSFVSAVLAIIDIIKIVIGKFTDGEGRVITEWT
ncbi:MAG: NINE protein [Treponema sp.]|nr:NINE protein [Treponema sp.]